jgi:hypothetical protein
MANQNHKQVKLQPRYRILSYGQRIVPELRVSGIWLEQHGFKAGGQVEITVSQNELIIKPLS